MSAELTICPEGHKYWDVFDPIALWDELHFSNHVFKFVCIKISKASLLGNVHLPAAREFELGPV